QARAGELGRRRGVLGNLAEGGLRRYGNRLRRLALHLRGQGRAGGQQRQRDETRNEAETAEEDRQHRQGLSLGSNHFAVPLVSFARTLSRVDEGYAMNKLLTIAAACVALLGNAAYAGLDVGEKAPDFKTDASLAGSVFKFSLGDALKKGAVVLYFYPAAFAVGCTVEAHEFAEATDTYKQLGATVIGVSHDDIETLKKFSVTECRNKFAVASDGDQSIMKSYDAVLALKPEFANRTSYVIAP